MKDFISRLLHKEPATLEDLTAKLIADTGRKLA